jgi:hypothetical protein
MKGDVVGRGTLFDGVGLGFIGFIGLGLGLGLPIVPPPCSD